MYFVVLNKLLALKPETYKDINVPFIIISISSHEEHFAVIPKIENCLDKLFMRYDDENYNIMDCSPMYRQHALPITVKDATRLLQFVDKYKNKVNDIIVHCEAGISRSTGTAVALSEIFNGKDTSDKYIQSIHGLKHANLLVRDLILQTYENGTLTP